MFGNESDLSLFAQQPEISVVVPIHNSEKYLQKCLDSILRQTFKNIEIILIDDGSIDTCANICQKYLTQDSRVKFYTQENHGAGYTRNRGLKLARGKYISFLDSDDFFELDFLDTLYQKAEFYKTDITFCNFYLYIEETGEEFPIKKCISKSVFNINNYPITFSDHIAGVVWNCLYNRKFLLGNKIKFQNLLASNDVFFSISSFVLAKKISLVQRCLIHYRIHIGSTIFQRDRNYKNIATAIKACENFIDTTKLLLPCIPLIFAKRFFVYNNSLREPIKSFYKKFLSTNVIPHLKSFQKNRVETNKYLLNFIQNTKNNRNYSFLFQESFYKRKDKILPIALFSNDDEYQNIIIQLQNIENKNLEILFDIYIFSSRLTNTQIMKLENLTKDNIRVTVFFIDNKSTTFQLKYSNFIFSKNIYLYKMYLHSFIYGYEKILCLNSNLLFSEDILSLFSVDLSDNLVAGFQKEFTSQEKIIYQNKYFLNPDFCINSEILLINLKLWEKEKSLLRTGNLINNYHLLDETILINLMCQNKILFLKKIYQQIFTNAIEYVEKNPVTLQQSKYYEEILFDNLLKNKVG